MRGSAGLRYLILALILLGACSDDVSEDVGLPMRNAERRTETDLWALRAGEAIDVRPTPSHINAPGPPAGLPAPTPRPTDAPEPPVPEPREADAPERIPDEPESVPVRAENLVDGVTLTVYSCYGDGTGAYCPWGNSMAGGEKVHRGAVACGYAWPLGTRLRIIGDPLGMVYTCKDRGGGLDYLHVDVWFMDYYAEGRPWRVQLGQPVTVELLP